MASFHRDGKRNESFIYERSSLREPDNFGNAEIRYNAGRRSNFHFWRDRAGHEVDLIVDRGDKLIPVEMKSGQTVAADSFKGLDWWKKLASEDDSFLVYGGDRSYDRAGTSVISWRDHDALRSTQT